jgi:hypothetical protein
LRNPYEYPVTTDEIVAVLTLLLETEHKRTEGNDPPVGDPTAWILEEAIARIKEAPTWTVTRTDDHGNSFVVREGLTLKDAGRLMRLLSERGHKQTYKVES